MVKLHVFFHGGLWKACTRGTMNTRLVASVMFGALGLIGAAVAMPASAAQTTRSVAVGSTRSAQSPISKPRVIITNDGEVDDMNSFIRYLYYSNEFDTEAIVLTSSEFHWAGNGADVAPFRWTGTQWINAYIDAYAEIYHNLAAQDDGYPTPEYLHSIYKIGNITNVGEMDQVTPGSEIIKERILDPNPQPLYVLAWGGTNTLARALKSIQEQYAGTPGWPSLQKTISDKVIVYNILTQDNTLANYIKPNWPDLKIINNQQAFWGFAYAWQFVVPSALQTTLKGNWLSTNIVNGHGPLAYQYRTMRDGKPTPGDDQNNRWDPNQNLNFGVNDFLSEGDTPSFLYLLDFNGLRSSENPTWGGWGGRFAPTSYGWLDTQDSDPFVSACGGFFVDPCKSYAQLRWINEFQNDFAARISWGDTSSYTDANHNPNVTVRQGLNITRNAGAAVPLNIAVSDPDGNAVSLDVWQYKDAGTYPGSVGITQAGNNGAYLIHIPADAVSGQTIHVIAQATDNGSPPLTRYARVVITVN